MAGAKAVASSRSSRLGRWGSLAGYALLSFAVLELSLFLVKRLGGNLFLATLVGILCAAVYAIISFRNLSLPFHIWILSVGGFRFLWSIQAPMMPDLYLDRMAMAWLILVFMVKWVAERRSLVGPFGIDLVVLGHALFLLVQVILNDMAHFHTWTNCVLIPYSAYFLAKNICSDLPKIRSLLWVLLALSIYYNVTSVAEKYNINALIWPHYIIGADVGFRGRSVGPFLQAPLFGTVIGMLLPVHLYFLATVQRSWARFLLVASLMLGLGGLYFTYTRGSWLTGVVALAVTVALNRRVYLRYMLPALVLAPVLAVAVLGLAQDKFMKERLENENTIGARLGTMVTVLRVWRDHPLFGVGFFEYANVRDQYVEAVELPGMPPIRFWQFRHNSIHDIYFGPLAETGLVGMGLQFAIYFLLLKLLLAKLAKSLNGDHFSTHVLPVFGGIMAGYLIGGLAIDYRFFSVVGSLFMLCGGIVAGYIPGDMRGARTAGALPPAPPV